MSYPRLLLLRYGLYNGIASALLGMAYAQGWVTIAIDADSTHTVALIAAVFSFGLALTAARVVTFGTALDELKRFGGTSLAPHPWLAGQAPPSQHVDALKLKLASRIAPIRHIAGALVLLGLIGTVLGFIIALGGLDPNAAADLSRLPAMLGTMIAGMSTALYTTLVGAVLNIWLMVNVRLLESAAARIVSAYLVGWDNG